MSLVVNYHINKESFLLACKICEQSNPSIAYDSIEYNKKHLENLTKLNAFIIGKNYWLEGEDGEYIDVIHKDNKAGYFDKNNKFISISYEKVCSYKLDFRWMIKAIAHNLEVETCYPEDMIIDNLFWRIGTLKSKTLAPIFFARSIENKTNFEKIYKSLLERKGLGKGIILTTSSSLPFGYNLPDNHQIISLKNCLVHDSNNFHIDKNIINAAISTRAESMELKEGFSDGYRTAYIKGVEYSFSKKQAAIIEALDKNGGRSNKYELLADADSEQYDLFRIFRDSKGIYHPAWDVIIKNDGKGNYWLNC